MGESKLKLKLEEDEKLVLINFIVNTEGRDDRVSKLDRIQEIISGEQEDE